MRILTTACAALLIAALSIAYGLTEKTEALEREISALEDRRDALNRELDVLDYEWSAASAPERLERLAAASFGEGALRDASGAPLAPWRPDQTLRLRRRDAQSPAAQDDAPAAEDDAPAAREEEEEARGAILTSSVAPRVEVGQ